MSLISIKYFMECVSYFFISMNITPKSLSRNLLTFLNISNKKRVILDVDKTNLKKSKQKLKETELFTYNSNGVELIRKEEEIFRQIDENNNLNGIEQQNNNDDLIDLLIFVLKDKQ